MNYIRRITVFFIVITFLITTLAPSARAAEMPWMPAPGTMITASPAYSPVIMKGLKVYPENPLLFDFILDTGASSLKTDNADLRAESQKLINYFLASLTIPEKDLWVNLSPFEKNRILSDNLAKTELGRDMLAQDYILKQLASSLLYPEKELGKAFWARIYAQAQERFGASDIPVDTFNKVWIMADKARVFEHDNTVFILNAHLKVMLESDYLAAQMAGPSAAQQPSSSSNNTAPSQELSKQIIREIILPAIEKEVNEGRNFAPLRQMFHSMILATWYKTALKNALLNQVYTDKGKTSGVLADDPAAREKIYARYLKAYRKGAFNYIREDVDAVSRQAIPRKYFSGGVHLAITKALDLTQDVTAKEKEAINEANDLYVVAVSVGKITGYKKSPPNDDDLLRFYRNNYTTKNDGKNIKDLWHEISKRTINSEDVKNMFPTGMRNETIKLFKNDKTLKANMLKSLAIMLNYYALDFKINESAVTIERSDTYEDRKESILKNNEDFLYVERILTSLKTVGLGTYAALFLDAIEKNYKDKISTDEQKDFLESWNSFIFGSPSIEKILPNLTPTEHKKNMTDAAMHKSKSNQKEFYKSRLLRFGIVSAVTTALALGYLSYVPWERVTEDNFKFELPSKFEIIPQSPALFTIQADSSPRGKILWSIDYNNKETFRYLNPKNEVIASATVEKNAHGAKIQIFNPESKFVGAIIEDISENPYALYSIPREELIKTYTIEAVGNTTLATAEMITSKWGSAIQLTDPDGRSMADIFHLNDKTASPNWQIRTHNPSIDPVILAILAAYKTSEDMGQRNSPAETKDDNATPTKPAMHAPGGIDLNAQNMDMNVARDGQGIEMKFDPAMIKEFQKGDFSGVEGVILRIVPIQNLLPILGLEK